MSIIFMLIPLTLVLVGLACWAFFWAVGNGQFDDLDTPAWDVLIDDVPTTQSTGESPAIRDSHHRGHHRDT